MESEKNTYIRFNSFYKIKHHDKSQSKRLMKPENHRIKRALEGIDFVMDRK